MGFTIGARREASHANHNTQQTADRVIQPPTDFRNTDIPTSLPHLTLCDLEATTLSRFLSKLAYLDFPKGEINQTDNTDTLCHQQKDGGRRNDRCSGECT